METTVIDADPGVGATSISKELPKQQDMRKMATSIMTLSEYDFLSMAFYGDGAFRDGTLIRPHEREDALSYQARREMAFLKNFLKPIVNARIDPVFSSPIVREVQDDAGQQAQAPLFTAFLEDCDNVGNDLGKFIEDAAREGNLQSLTFLIVDNYTKFNKSVTANVDQRLFPYIYRQDRDTLKDYGVDRYGKIEWIRFFDHSEKQSDGKQVDFYRYWDKVNSILQKAVLVNGELTYTDMETNQHKLGIVPVYPLTFISARKKRGSKRQADTLSIDYEFYDLARCNWTIYNLDSATMEAIFDQCFSLLCIQGTKSSDVTTGTKTVCWVEPDVQNMPLFVSPDPNVAKIASDYADKIKIVLYEIAEQNGVTAVKANGASGITEQSGKAKEWDFRAHGFVLKKVSGICRAAELWVADVFKRYTGEVFTYVPRYKDDFAIRDSDVLIGVQERVLEDGFGPEGQALARKNIARVAFAHNDEEEVKTVIEEIEGGVEDAIQAAKDAEDAAAAVIPDESGANVPLMAKAGTGPQPGTNAQPGFVQQGG